MRDIDFDELDRAVNSYLDKKTDKKPEIRRDVVSSWVEKHPEEAREKVAAPEKREARKMVFSRRAVVNAGSFHGGAVSGGDNLTVAETSKKTEKTISKEDSKKDKKIESPKKPEAKVEKKIQKPEQKQAGRKIAGRASEPDFAKYLKESEEKVLGEISARHTPRVGVFENFELRDDTVARAVAAEQEDAAQYAKKRNDFGEKLEPSHAKYEAPVLVADDSTKVSKEENASVAEISKAEKKVEEKRESRWSGRAPYLTVPTRGGVFSVENEEKMTVISGEEKVSEASKEEKTPEATEEKREESIAISINKKRQEKTGEVAVVAKPEARAIGAVAKKAETFEKENSSTKIGIKIVDEDAVKPAEKTKKKPEEKKAIFSPKPLAKKPKADKIITRPASGQGIDDIKTPFVQNAKISKRPLGLDAAAIASSFEMKKDLAERQKKIKQAKIENRQPQMPILAREDYVAPVVPRKQKSGWGVVLGILLITALISIGVGLAVYYFSLS